MRVALATSRELAELHDEDGPLVAALLERGVSAEPAVWDDADVDWSSFAAVVLRSTWDYNERHDHFLAWVDQIDQVVPLFNDAETVRWNTHKGYLQQLEAAGVPVVPTRWLSANTSASLVDVLNDAHWPQAVVKPAVGAGGAGVAKISVDDRDGQRHLDDLLAVGDVMIQPYLGGVAEGEASLVWIDGEVTHAVCKQPAAGEYRVQSIYGGDVERFDPTPAQCDAAERALAAMSATTLLYARVDLLPGDTGPLVGELELVEPSLFFTEAPAAAGRMADGLLARLEVAS